MTYQQKGVALITVLFVVVVVTVLAASMTKDQNIAIHRARNYFDFLQVKEYALSGEEVARQLLRADFIKNPAIDHGGENWAAEALQFEFEGGAVEIRISDLQSRFNLNNLMNSTEKGPINQARFRQLLNHLAIDPAISDRIADWIDDNQNARPLGAEDYQYLGLEVPYRSSSVFMADISELRLILDMEEETLDKLKPHVTVLPTSDSMINVNTASEQVLLMLANSLSQEQVEQAIELRKPDGYSDLPSFTQSIGTPADLDVAGLSVSSSYFQIDVVARYNDRFGYLTSILERNPTDGTMKIIYRDFSKKLLPSS